MEKRSLVFVFLCIGLVLGGSLAVLAPGPKEQQVLEWLETPRSLAPFSLETEQGVFNKDSLLDSWTIVVFGFVNCPDICPTSLSQVHKLTKQMEATSHSMDLNVVFVSVDPARDSLTELGGYVSSSPRRSLVSLVKPVSWLH